MSACLTRSADCAAGRCPSPDCPNTLRGEFLLRLSPGMTEPNRYRRERARLSDGQTLWGWGLDRLGMTR